MVEVLEELDLPQYALGVDHVIKSPGDLLDGHLLACHSVDRRAARAWHSIRGTYTSGIGGSTVVNGSQFPEGLGGR